ncbi:endo alpha-1,4 polygalactosaminidase [Myxococcota bacterium]|nr:endo alpha-1,4 polygalactosaminidase [Myxococcota bacterium]MBU1382022.1 endo alpha-1,4 polygalactosaminidase [Myxococcota bacterium]MBU1495336.1 endo alpha-1,4 polygalactosaminidase [Myxococcota bacterium]
MKLFIFSISFCLLVSGCGSSDNPNNNNNNQNNTSNNTNNNTNNTNNTLGEYTIPVNTTWNWQLSVTPPDLSDDFEMYDIDLFEITPNEIQTIHEAGALVICYFSAGSFEEWREDANDFTVSDIGNELDGWDGENWLNISSDTVKNIMENRLDLAVEKGCDGVEPDNIDGYTNDSGFDLSYEDQLLYNIWLANEAHLRGLSIGLKNDGDQVVDLINYFDWALNEECVYYNECHLYRAFIEAGKAVFHVEYVDNETEGNSLADSVCNDSQRQNFSTLIKKWDLDYWFLTCN